MRLFTLAVCLGYAALTLSAADGVGFTTITSWDEALTLAKTTGKPIFLDAYTDWCGWCKVMDKETFSDAKVAEVMNASFVCVKMEMETGEGVDVAMKYRVSSYPTFMFFTPDGIPTYRVSGYEPPEKWLQSLSNAKDPSQRIKAPGITPTLKLKYPEWHRVSFLKGNTRKFPDTAVSRAWFEKYEDKYDEVAWGVLLRQDLGETWEKWALEHESEYASRYGDEVDQLHRKLSQRYFMRAVQKKDPTWIESAVDVAKTGSADQKMHLLLRYTGLYGQRVKDWDVVGRVAKDMADRPDIANYTSDINEFSWSIYEKGEGANALTNAIYAMEKITKDPSAEWAHLDTYAALLYKAGRINDALVAAERAIEGGRAAGADVKETEALLEKIKAGK